MNKIEEALAKLSNNFTDDKVAVRCWSKADTNNANEILREHYSNIKITENKKDNKDSWILSCSERITESLLTEADDDFEMDLSEFDDLNPNDDLDLQDQGLDSIDDTGDIADANQLTVLKRRAADLAEKWKDTFKQISDLARNLELVASHDEDLNIEISKPDGTESEVKTDLDIIKDEIDDSFGPSEYDNRADELKDDEGIPVENKAQEISNESLMKFDPNELKISEDEVDDDF